MATQTNEFKARVQQKHDIEANWLKASGFTPLQGEVIIYDVEIDENDMVLDLTDTGRITPYIYERIKIGDGKTNVNDLPFVLDAAAGQVTLSDGVIFNDYENNQAFGPYSYAAGSGTKAGTGMYQITGINSSTNSITEYDTFALNTVTGLEVGLECSCQVGNNYDFFGTITSIDTTTNQVTFDNVIIEVPTDDIPSADNQETWGTLWVPSRPDLGDGVTFGGTGAYAAGYGSVASMIGAVALGRENQSSGKFSFTAGSRNKAVWCASALGVENKALGQASLAVGNNNTTKGLYSFAQGSFNSAEGNMATALGQNSHATGAHSFAVGFNSYATAQYAFAQGNSTIAKGPASVALGASSTADGAYAFVAGNGNVATYGAIALGINNYATGESSMAQGYGNNASAKYAVALGKSSQASNIGAIAIGNGAKASGEGAVALGTGSIATNIAAVAAGSYSEANASASVSMGSRNKVSGYASAAIGGDSNTINGQYSFGTGTGNNIQAGTTRGVVFGNGGTIADTATNGFLAGESCFVNGATKNATAFGKGTWAAFDTQFAIGEYNRPLRDALFQVGNGTSSTKSNAFEVYRDGSAIVSKNLTVSGDIISNGNIYGLNIYLAGTHLNNLFAAKNDVIKKHMKFENLRLGSRPTVGTACPTDFQKYSIFVVEVSPETQAADVDLYAQITLFPAGVDSNGNVNSWKSVNSETLYDRVNGNILQPGLEISASISLDNQNLLWGDGSVTVDGDYGITNSFIYIDKIIGIC